MIASTNENKTVEANITPSFAIGERTKKRVNADMVGNREARMVLNVSMTARTVLSR
jgi:hypothetical protein